MAPVDNTRIYGIESLLSLTSGCRTMISYPFKRTDINSAKDHRLKLITVSGLDNVSKITSYTTLPLLEQG